MRERAKSYLKCKPRLSAKGSFSEHPAMPTCPPGITDIGVSHIGGTIKSDTPVAQLTPKTSTHGAWRLKGKLRGKKPRLSDKRQRELRCMYNTGDYSISDLAELFAVS